MRWLEPVPLDPEGGAQPLGGAAIASWRERGFALVDGLLPRDLLERARADAVAAFPRPGDRTADAVTDFGSGGRMEFPADSAAANEITLHPRLLAAIGQLLDLGVRDLRLTQSDLWPKYGRTSQRGDDRDNRDQRIHVDYPNHTLTHPPRWETPEAVELLLYLSDVDECGGATAVVPREGPDDPAYRWPIVDTPGVGDLDWKNDREQAEAYLRANAPDIARFRATELYPREARVRYRLGTLLLYRHDTWHRGTPIEPGALRVVQNMTFRKAASEWVSVLHPGWAWSMYRRSRVMEHLIANASVDQRCVLGFPAPGDAYWSRETLAAVTARYGVLGFDPEPYFQALSADEA